MQLIDGKAVAAQIKQEIAEEVSRSLTGKAVAAEHGDEVAQCVPCNHAAQHQVEAKDAEAGYNSAPANPGILRRHLFISAHNALTGLAAQSHLAQHYTKANEYGQNKINKQECEAAVLAHLVREAPNVAKAHSGADGSHYEAEVGAKSSTRLSFFHTILSLMIIFSGHIYQAGPRSFYAC